MTYAAVAPPEFTLFNRGRLSRAPARKTLAGVSALAISVLVMAGAWEIDGRYPPVHAPAERVAVAALGRTRTINVTTVAAKPRIAVAARTYDPLLDPAYSLGSAPVAFAQDAPVYQTFASAAALEPATQPTAAAKLTVADASAEVDADPEADATPDEVLPLPVPRGVPAVVSVTQAVPLPMPRPSELDAAPSREPQLRRPSRQVLQRTRMARLSPPAADNRSFFDKIFGVQEQQPGSALGYAASEDGMFGSGQRLTAGPVADRQTAIYEIATHTVYLPNGERLEAHSGLGQNLDDPRSVRERNRGATPPSLYELTPREALFHGVQALRLTPIGGGSTFGRSGLLAHTFMLGPNGDSNGCVSFRNYNAFLQAYRNGEIRRLAVVARL